MRFYQKRQPVNKSKKKIATENETAIMQQNTDGYGSDASEGVNNRAVNTVFGEGERISKKKIKKEKNE